MQENLQWNCLLGNDPEKLSILAEGGFRKFLGMHLMCIDITSICTPLVIEVQTVGDAKEVDDHYGCLHANIDAW